ncbi:hypothetical protein LPJ61_001037 [Coemansia biformis]|uniref:DUF4272 domain-containing protein n=1 Tax=Coemansia biformis TaxID=1286918 RepID=A0A9W7YFM6_9FUNG|nr:hypothetical protein LPJ61_001037 [Coemansia biformis]
MGFRATAVMRQALKLRPAAELARRSSCLQLVLARWGLETAALMGLRGDQTANDEERKARAVDAITSALYESGLDGHASASERAMLEKPYGAWEYDDYVYGDHWEAMGVLQWLLARQHAIPPYYSSFDRAQLFQNTGIMPADPSTIETFVDSFAPARVQPHIGTQQLRTAVGAAEAWLWRARAQVILDLPSDIGGVDAQPSPGDKEAPVEAVLRARRIPHSLRKMAADLPRTIPLAAKRAHELGAVDKVEGDDFGIAVEVTGGASEGPPAGPARPTTVPYRGLDAGHLDALRKIAESRFLAFAWALGKIDDWDPDRTGDLVSINPINAIWTPDGE